MELCARGCGKEYHGYSKCNIPLNEQTEYELKRIGDQCSCPNCKAKIIKQEGCNHMTCICGTEFCYVCKKEYVTDQYGKYSITKHYQDNNAQNYCKRSH